MPYLPRHVEGLKAWLDLAAEVVVVDSYSMDGTVDFLRAHISHPQLRFTTHPPGLYASWNHGVAQIRSEYVVVSTTGETITRAGICQLVDVAQALACDVVISRPNFCDAAGQPRPAIPWPADDVIRTLNVRQPYRLGQLEAVIFAAVHATNALTGSCASDLFRTRVLQRLPFPTDFGTAGDAMWGLMHAAEVVWGIVPERFSTFVLHPTNASAAEKQTWLAARRADAVLRAAMDSWRRSGLITEEKIPSAIWEALMARLTCQLDAKAAFDRNRRGPIPWILIPRAWKNRMQREHAARSLHKLKHVALLGTP